MRVRAATIVIAALLASGCSTLNDLLDQNKVDYKSASQNRLGWKGTGKSSGAGEGWGGGPGS